MRGTGLLLASCVCLTAQQAGIEGFAVNALTGQPLSGVHVRFFTGSSDGVDRNYGALSDSAGHFSITGMQPGSYLLSPQKTGFVFVAKRVGAVPSNLVTLRSGQHLADFKVVMTPRAVISGRVLDENGEPVANVMVQAEPIARDASPPTSSLGRIMNTNDRGEFRIISVPGKYRIKATPHNMRDETEIRTDGSSAAAYGPTYYPSSAGKEQGGVVEAAAGGDTAGIDIRLVHPPRGLTISGVVSGIPEAGRGVSVMIQSGEAPERMNNMNGRGTTSDGKFVLHNLPPQFYRVFAQYRSGNIQLQSQTVELRPDSGDVTNLELVLSPGEDLAGKLEIAGDPSAEKRLIRLESVGMYFRGSPTAEVDKDGTFRFTESPAGQIPRARGSAAGKRVLQSNSARWRRRCGPHAGPLPWSTRIELADYRGP